MKRSFLITVALVSALVLGASIVPAWAYFTDTTMATGGMPVTVGTDTEMHEWYAQSTKHVVISNSEDSATPVYVRARVYCPTQLPGVSYTAVGEGWPAAPEADGWYYYSALVDPGKDANELTVTITFPPVQSEEQPDGAVYGDNFSVVVYYESTPAIWNSQANAYDPADWGKVVYAGADERGN